MSDIKSKAQGLDPNVRARDVRGMVSETKNIYETLSIISKRAKQISVDMKIELHQKLDEFAVSSDTIEEVHENKEQIEISKYYEQLPKPSLLAIQEYLEDKTYYRNPSKMN